MGKIVKYCANCEESFAEKFSYCPNCAAGLTSYEMNPIPAATSVAEPPKPQEPIKAADPAPIAKAETFQPKASEPVAAERENSFKTRVDLPKTNVSAAEYQAESRTPKLDEKPAAAQTNHVSESANVNSAPVITVPAAVAAANVEDQRRSASNQKTFVASSAKNADAVQQPKASTVSRTLNNNGGGYNITFVEEKNNGIRRMLLLGAFLFVMLGTVGGVVASLYTSDALVGSIDQDSVLVAYTEDVPAPEEEQPEPPKIKNEDKGGGGGGGGKQEKTETSKGVLATQMEKPMIAPSVTMDRVTKPAIPITMATEGKNKIPPTNEKYGNPNSLSTIPSDGTGSGGGQGSGIGRGQGSGRGTGAGSGIGSGMGSGIGNGNGSGTGPGSGDDPPAIKPPPPAGPTVGVQVTAKPRANYTDAARQAQVQGTVTLRVTFLADGSIGSISTINGLPNGLTEQAIAAARGMRFEPAKRAGVPYTVTKNVQYNFTLY